MKTLFGITLGTLLLAGCGSAAPALPEISPASPMLQPPPISALIGYRTPLALTSPQVVTLDSIGEATRDRNSALFTQLRERRAAPADTSSATAPQAVLAEIRKSNQAAAEAVRTVLNEEQRTRACELFRRAREERTRSARGQSAREQSTREQPMRRSRGELPDSLFAQRAAWPWCAPGSATAPADTGR